MKNDLALVCMQIHQPINCIHNVLHDANMRTAKKTSKRANGEIAGGIKRIKADLPILLK